MGNLRAFISVNIPEEIQDEIKKIQDSLPEFKGKKTELENLHLTLKFLGKISEEILEKIKEKLIKIKFKKFETEMDEIGYFDKHDRGIVWLHLTSCEQLQKEIDESISNLFGKEKRFMGHLTIARIKKIKNKKEFLEKLSKIKIKKSRFIINKFFLMKSELNEEGPIYSVIEEFPLGD